jgi:hypothetical protein
MGGTSSARHVPRPVLRAMSILLRYVNPMFARHTRAAVVMDTSDMTFDSGNARRRFLDLPETSLASALALFVRQREAEIVTPAALAPQR